MTRTRLLVLLISAFLAVFWLWGEPDRAPRPARAVPAARLAAEAGPLAADPAAPARPAGLGLLPGDILRYRFALDRLTGVRMVENAEPVDQRFVHEGAFSLMVYAAEPDGWTVGLALTELDVDMTSTIGGRVHPSDEPAPRLDGEVLLRIARSGEIGTIAFPKETSGAARRLLKEILTHWRIVLDVDPAATAWETLERDVTGTYRARYERRGPGEIVKSKLEYTAFAVQGDLGVEGRGTGRTVYELDPLPRRVEGRDRLGLLLQGSKARIDSEIAFRYVRVAHERRAVDAPRAVAGGTTLYEAEKPDRDVDSEKVRLWARQELDALAKLAATRAIPSADADHIARKLVRVIQLGDVGAAEVRRQLSDASCTDAMHALLASTLGLAGTPAAQGVLAELLAEGRWSDERRRDTLFALLYVKEPVAELDRALVRLHHDNARLAGHTLMFLGTIGHRVLGRDAARFDRIRDFMEERLGAARDHREKANVLAAMGNLGADDVSDQVRAALDDQSWIARSAALRALRRVRAAEVDGILVRKAREDAAPPVRTAALETLVSRHRAGLADAKALGLPLRELLAQIAAEDAAKPVRDAAQRLHDQLEAAPVP
jgi:hypothetical protein